MKILPLLVFCVSMNRAAADIHVSPTGSDTNPGTLERPVQTPTKARDIAREQIREGLKDPLKIIFAAGTYTLHETLELRPEDSGTAEFPVIWKAADGAKVILSGGLPLQKSWTQGADRIWQVDLKGRGPDAWNFRQLFIDGKRATRARFPNADAANPFLYATGGDMDHVMIAPSLIKPSWNNARDAQINIVPNWRFFNQWNTLTKVDPKTGRIDIADSERHGKIIAGNWFWIEGVKEELDQPGEWFLDATQGILYYMPPVGIDPNTLDIVAPVLNRLINAQGDVNAGTHAQSVTSRLGSTPIPLSCSRTPSILQSATATLKTSAATRFGCISTASATPSTATPCATREAAVY